MFHNDKNFNVLGFKRSKQLFQREIRSRRLCALVWCRSTSCTSSSICFETRQSPAGPLLYSKFRLVFPAALKRISTIPKTPLKNVLTGSVPWRARENINSYTNEPRLDINGAMLWGCFVSVMKHTLPRGLMTATAESKYWSNRRYY